MSVSCSGCETVLESAAPTEPSVVQCYSCGLEIGVNPQGSSGNGSCAAILGPALSSDPSYSFSDQDSEPYSSDNNYGDY